MDTKKNRLQKAGPALNQAMVAVSNAMYDALYIDHDEALVQELKTIQRCIGMAQERTANLLA